MDKKEAISALAALAQATRLDVYCLLAAHEPEGLPAGTIAERLGVPQNTLSTHLGVLTRAGLAKPQKRSRFIIYRAQVAHMSALLGFLAQESGFGSEPEMPSPSTS